MCDGWLVGTRHDGRFAAIGLLPWLDPQSYAVSTMLRDGSDTADAFDATYAALAQPVSSGSRTTKRSPPPPPRWLPLY